MKAIFCGMVLLIGVAVRGADADMELRLERALVTIEVNRKDYDFFQPWTKRVAQSVKAGVILEGGEILTTADALNDHTLIRLQKGGRGRWYQGKLKWVDYHANLALVECDEARFWTGTASLPLAARTAHKGMAELARWRGGVLEVRSVELNRVSVDNSKLSFIDLPFLVAETEVEGLGWGEILIKDGEIIGLTSSKTGRMLHAIPSFLIQACLEDLADPPYAGLGFFAFYWRPAENPDLTSHLGLGGEPKGVVVTSVWTNKLETILQPKDLILEIEGFPIDVQGDYQDPDYGFLLLENLASRAKRAGDAVKMKIWRNRQEIDLTYTLPKADFNHEMAPVMLPDREPEYLLLGGLLFQPLTVPYLQSWGDGDWRRKAPFRLVLAASAQSTDEQPGMVLLSLVLPDPVNLGYQDARYLPVRLVNRKKVYSLKDIQEAVKTPVDGFHIIEFIKGDSLQRLVLDAREAEEANPRILERYGIPANSVIY